MERLHVLLVFCACAVTCLAQCPWPRDMTDLHSSCICALSPESKLSVQCQFVDFSRLLGALRASVPNQELDLLYVSNSSIPSLPNNVFANLLVQNVQFSDCDVEEIQIGAFTGLESRLMNINLAGNRLTQVPTGALSKLKRLSLLDLSKNRITDIPDGAFDTLSLQTLKLADNNLTLSVGAFSGLENSLKNLNLKGTGLRSLPAAVSQLASLAFLDLAQNSITRLYPMAFASLQSLTALNLERNLIQQLDGSVFLGVNDTLSSLSLLNNLIAEFPTKAMSALGGLRVLDIGFNLLTELPEDSLRQMKSLTLLALDGNPLSTLPEQTFAHLRSTLRGLSLGGRFLTCDCRVRWIAEWIRDFDLQVTSRERNPQFCGNPPEFRDRTFYQLNAEEFECVADTTTSTSTEAKTPDTTTSTTTERQETTGSAAVVKEARPLPVLPILPAASPTQRTRRPTAEVQITRRPPTQRATTFRPVYTQPPYRREPPAAPAADPATPARAGEAQSSIQAQRPNLIFRPEGASSREASVRDEVRVQDAYRRGSSVVIQWESDVPNILGFRVVYRLFGDDTFKQGPPLAPSEKEFKIKNVPSQECIVVCVVSLEDIDISPETVPLRQCREIRTDAAAPTHMDTFVIAASAAICGTIIIAVIIFVCCNRRRSREKKDLPTIMSTTPAPPLASIGTLRGTGKDWDQMSMYSHRSIPRARMYHVDKAGSVRGSYMGEEAPAPLSRASSRRRSLADGQSLRSYSAMSGHYPGLAAGAGLALPRPELRTSHTSLASGYVGERRRSRRMSSRDRSSSRLSGIAAGGHYTDETDGWTDHDMDIYMTSNATARGSNNLVQL